MKCFVMHLWTMGLLQMGRHPDRPGTYREPRRKLHPLVYILRKRRYELGLSSRACAEHAGYAAATIQQWECGQATPTLVNLETWAESLNLKLVLEEKC